MTERTIHAAKRRGRIRKFIYLILFTITIYLWMVISGDRVQSIVSALTPPQLPELETQTSNGEWLTQKWLYQNWGNSKLGFDEEEKSANSESGSAEEENWGNSKFGLSEETLKYHHINQGASTLPIPYNWLINLEQPADSIFRVLFSKKGKFVDNNYLLRFGFIRARRICLSCK